MTSDGELLRRYVEADSEEAFGELVRRHLNLVHSAALRQVNGDAHLAQDVAQSVFTDLARKAGSLAQRPVLTGWLHTSTHFAAATAVRTERRRYTREQEAHAMQESLQDPGPNPDWETLRPLLDTAMHELNEADREVILLRYFENRQHADIGEQFGLSENAARMRVERALERLRAEFNRRGMTTTAVALSTAVSANAVSLAPAGLAASLSTAALAGTTSAATATAVASAATGGGTRLTLLKIATMTKLKAGILAAIVVAGVATPLVIEHQAQIKLAEKDSLLQQQSEQLTQLVSESQRLSNLLAQASPSRSLPSDQLMELLRLRSEVGALRQQTKAGTAVATAASADYWPRDSWNFVGYVSPAAALQSYFWAASKGDVESFRASITGDAQKSMELQAESIAQAFVSAQVAGLKSVRVLHREVQADDTVVLTAALEKETGNEERKLLMKKVGTEWKFSAYLNN